MMDRIMKKSHLVFVTCLLLISFQSYANRPAEDDPSPAVSQSLPESESSSNVPAPVPAYSQSVPEAPPVEIITNEQSRSGDVIATPQNSSDTNIILLDFPKRGMVMSKVLNELGEPVTRFPAIGKPPITRWAYPDRIVFFEYSHVIHVVAK